MNTKKQLVNFQIATKIKEAGFNEPCICLFKDGVSFLIHQQEYDRFYLDRFFEFTNSDAAEFTNVMTEYCEEGEDYAVNCISQPFYGQVLDWLEINHYIDIWLVPFLSENPKVYKYHILHRGVETVSVLCFGKQEALDNAILESLKLI